MLTLTVLDTATIYEGRESIFRYDLPGTGVVEGWALAGVIEQAHKSAGPDWPGVDVLVVADSTGTDVSDEAVSIIVRHLRMAGVTTVSSNPAPQTASLSAASASGGAAAAQPAHPGQGRDDVTVDEAFPARRPRGWGSTGRGGAFAERPAWVGIAAIGVVVLVACAALALWGMQSAAREPARSAASASTSAARGMTAGTPDSVLLSVAPTPGGSSSAAPGGPGDERPGEGAGAHERIEAAGMIMDVPPGFHWTEEGGLVTATGADPNLRILFAADPLYSVPAEALLAELRAQIESDDTLSQPVEDRGRLTYLETPGDGSEVAWTTWVEGDHQLSVGCHTRATPTLAHKAACRMAKDSLALRPDA